MRRRICVLAALLLAVAGCSSKKEGTTSSTSTSKKGACTPSPSAESAYKAPWTQGAQAFGVGKLDITEIPICSVNTSKLKQPPKNGSYRIAFAAQGTM